MQYNRSQQTNRERSVGPDGHPSTRGGHESTTRLAHGLSPQLIRGLLGKWLAKLPQPLTAADREAGYDYDASIPAR